MIERYLDVAILVLAAIFLLSSLLIIVTALATRRRGGLYDVQRIQRRQSAMSRFAQGSALGVVGLILLGAWGVFQLTGNQPEATDAQPTRPLVVQDVAPTAEATSLPPTATPSILPGPTTTATLPPPATLPSAEPSDAVTPTIETAVSATATATVTLTDVTSVTEAPSPTATPVPTLPPYDAEVSIIGGLYLRDAPNGNIILLLEDGTGVNLLDGSELSGNYTWQEIQTLDGASGWVAEQFLIIFAEP